MIRIAEMEATRSILREWTWRKDHSTMIPQKTVHKVIIIQILITNLNIDKSLAIIRNRMIMSPIDLEIWGNLREKPIRAAIMAKGWMQRKVDPEIIIKDLKIEDQAILATQKMKIQIKILFKILNKNLINPLIIKLKLTNLLRKRNRMKV